MMIRGQVRQPLLSFPLIFQPSFISTVGSGKPIRPNEGDCCGSGCEHCVWIVYFSDLLAHYENSPQVDSRKRRKEKKKE